MVNARVMDHMHNGVAYLYIVSKRSFCAKKKKKNTYVTKVIKTQRIQFVKSKLDYLFLEERKSEVSDFLQVLVTF